MRFDNNWSTFPSQSGVTKGSVDCLKCSADIQHGIGDIFSCSSGCIWRVVCVGLSRVVKLRVVVWTEQQAVVC